MKHGARDYKLNFYAPTIDLNWAYKLHIIYEQKP